MAVGENSDSPVNLTPSEPQSMINNPSLNIANVDQAVGHITTECIDYEEIDLTTTPTSTMSPAAHETDQVAGNAETSDPVAGQSSPEIASASAS